jgi:tetratricopeptide (TPR) repeat protein
MADSNRRSGARPAGGGGGRPRGGPKAGGPKGGSKGRSGPPGKRGPSTSSRGPGGKGTGGPPGGRRSGGTRPAKPKRDDGRRGPKSWGGVARRGAGELETPRPDTASDEWRKAVQRSRDGQDTGVGPDNEDQWYEDDEYVDEDEGGAAPGRETGRVDVDLSDDDRRKLARESGRKAGDHEQRIKDAAKAFRAERFQDAQRILGNLAEVAPSVPAVRELNGLTLYRLRRWKLAAAELEAFRALTHSTEQHPVLADCYRALKRIDPVRELWDELREASPSAELVTEGRIVMAGALADRGDVKAAIDLLGQNAWKLPRQPRDHHLRRAYALADLLERAGEVSRARDLFGRIQRADARFGDVGRRLKAL